MKTILVTGGAGFIGTNFIKYLSRDHNYNIINVDKLSYGSNIDNLNDINDNYLFIKKDINDDLSDIIDNVDYIVNFAAESHVDRSIAEPKKFTKANINGVINLLENVRKADNNPKIIQIGTDEEYGDIMEGSFSEENLLKLLLAVNRAVLYFQIIAISSFNHLWK